MKATRFLPSDFCWKSQGLENISKSLQYLLSAQKHIDGKCPDQCLMKEFSSWQGKKENSQCVSAAPGTHGPRNTRGRAGAIAS